MYNSVFPVPEGRLKPQSFSEHKFTRVGLLPSADTLRNWDVCLTPLTAYQSACASVQASVRCNLHISKKTKSEQFEDGFVLYGGVLVNVGLNCEVSFFLSPCCLFVGADCASDLYFWSCGNAKPFLQIRYTCHCIPRVYIPKNKHDFGYFYVLSMFLRYEINWSWVFEVLYICINVLHVQYFIHCVSPCFIAIKTKK